jgi:hypothetical protein
MIREVGKHITQVGRRIDAVELGGADERVDRGGALAAAVGSLRPRRSFRPGFTTQTAKKGAVLGDHSAGMEAGTKGTDRE